MNLTIEVDKITKRYGATLALDSVSFSVKEGELFALLGPNGAGKTTLVRILTGLTRIGEGKARVSGESGLVPQSINLDYDLTAKENLLIHGILYAMPRDQIKKRTKELLDFTGLADSPDVEVRALSGGMKRRLLIARALMHKPKVLFLDEPTVGLDPNIRRKTWALIKRIQHAGTTILLTTHYIEEAEYLADRVAILNHGKIVALDTPVNLMENLGSYALDIVTEDEIISHYFTDKETAKAAMLKYGDADCTLTLRRVTLEDVVIKLTGHKVDT